MAKRKLIAHTVIVVLLLSVSVALMAVGGMKYYAAEKWKNDSFFPAYSLASAGEVTLSLKGPVLFQGARIAGNSECLMTVVSDKYALTQSSCVLGRTSVAVKNTDTGQVLYGNISIAGQLESNREITVLKIDKGRGVYNFVRPFRLDRMSTVSTLGDDYRGAWGRVIGDPGDPYRHVVVADFYVSDGVYGGPVFDNKGFIIGIVAPQYQGKNVFVPLTKDVFDELETFEGMNLGR